MRDTSMDVGEANGTSGKPSTPHQRQRSFGQQPQSPSAADQGTATISVLSATGFQADTKLEIKILHDSSKGLKEVLKTKAVKTKTGEVTYDDESKKVPCSADHQFRIHVLDSHTFGSDDDLGEAGFFVNDQSSGGTQEVKVGTGVVVIRSSFMPADAVSTRPTSLAPDSPASKKHLSRLVSRKERSVTPSG